MVEEADILAELQHAQTGIEALDFEDATETDDQPVDETLAKLCVDAFQVSTPTFMKHWHTRGHASIHDLLWRDSWFQDQTQAETRSMAPTTSTAYCSSAAQRPSTTIISQTPVSQLV